MDIAELSSQARATLPDTGAANTAQAAPPQAVARAGSKPAHSEASSPPRPAAPRPQAPSKVAEARHGAGSAPRASQADEGSDGDESEPDSRANVPPPDDAELHRKKGKGRVSDHASDRTSKQATLDSVVRTLPFLAT